MVIGAETYTFTDRAGWGPGPWDDEPDKLVWVDEATGLDCMIHRNPRGALCGYVGVAPGHPWHGKGYNDCTLPTPCGEPYCMHGVACGLDVHGGLTYAKACQTRRDDGSGICHVPQPGRPADVWWFGFDCAHLHDEAPGALYTCDSESDYRDVAYVTREVERLAEQLKAVAS